ncbi:hypothetical protein MTR_4g101925 [Medicago truncatula]|uniref:Uncharacterized protein n=1 Tax=Medicago truncatula TaxID=3880 RepID=A0A072URH0_MEDTR|nr:hypothetical protein MTR_4g101925 [Medicago truncatula]
MYAKSWSQYSKLSTIALTKELPKLKETILSAFSSRYQSYKSIEGKHQFYIIMQNVQFVQIPLPYNDSAAIASI